MIEHVYRRTAAASRVHAVIVATDDERIARAVEAFGGAALMTRPDHVSGTDRIAEAIAGLRCGIVVNVQGDEPQIEPATIDAAIAPLLADTAVGMSTLCRPFTDRAEFENRNVVKVVTNNSGDALYFSRAPLAGASAHIGLYVYRRETLLKLAATPAARLELAESLEQLRALTHGVKIRVVETSHAAAGVDTPEDLERVRRMLRAFARDDSQAVSHSRT